MILLALFAVPASSEELSKFTKAPHKFNVLDYDKSCQELIQNNSDPNGKAPIFLFTGSSWCGHCVQLENAGIPPLKEASREKVGVKRSRAQVYVSEAPGPHDATQCMREMYAARGKKGWGFPSVLFFKDGKWQTKAISAGNTKELADWFGADVFGKEGAVSENGGSFSGSHRSP